MDFYTDYHYLDRKTKAEYVWRKYFQILSGELLDVGADECYIKQFLPHDVKYVGIGLGGNLDINIDLEKEVIPFGKQTFDCVICLDVLEHIENIHEIFDKICGISRNYVIISLPNPWAGIWNCCKNGDYNREQALKFYGLPIEKPLDRHKWFFSFDEAEKFLNYRAKLNHMDIIQIDYEGSFDAKSIKMRFFEFFLSIYLWPLLRNKGVIDRFLTRSIWVVLKRQV